MLDLDATFNQHQFPPLPFSFATCRIQPRHNGRHQSLCVRMHMQLREAVIHQISPGAQITTSIGVFKKGVPTSFTQQQGGMLSTHGPNFLMTTVQKGNVLFQTQCSGHHLTLFQAIGCCHSIQETTHLKRLDFPGCICALTTATSTCRRDRHASDVAAAAAPTLDRPSQIAGPTDAQLGHRAARLTAFHPTFGCASMHVGHQKLPHHCPARQHISQCWRLWCLQMGQAHSRVNGSRSTVQTTRGCLGH